ncbi:MAG: Rieske 2Fe-2S domain-containing protein [Phormidesmis sp.]
MSSQQHPNRRRFLRYFIGASAATVALDWILPDHVSASTSDLEWLCTRYPYNSRCENYPSGVAALDQNDQPYTASAVLATASVGDRIPAEGLDRLAYLVVEDGPAISTYAISAVCTHRGCAVDWDAAAQMFVCPCHGSRYDEAGRVAEGPARRDLALIAVVVKEDQVRLVDRTSVTP